MENLKTSVSSKFSQLWTCYLEFEKVSRISGENLGDFLNKWKEKMSNAQSAGCNYSDALLACKLLERSNLDSDAFQSIITFVEDSGPDPLFSEVLSRLEGLITEENLQLDKGIFISSVFGQEENEDLPEIHEENEDLPGIHEENKDLPEIHEENEDLSEIHEEWIEHSPIDAEIQSPEDCEFSPNKLAKIKKVKKEDPRKKSRTCQICGKSFLKPYKLRNHMVSHTKEKNFKCEFCPSAYRLKDGLKIHMKKHLENKSLKCPNCPKIFVCDFDLKMHVRYVHPIDGRFKCDKCNFKTKTQKRLDTHFMSFHSSHPFKCNLCGRLFKSKKVVMGHLACIHKRELHKFDSIEELIGKNGENLKASTNSTLQGTLSTSPVLNNVENEGPVKNDNQSKENPLQDSELQLSEQTTDFSGGSSSFGSSHENMSRENEPSQKLFYSCDICGKCYQKEENFLRHCQQVHGPGVKKPVVQNPVGHKSTTCHICGFTVSRHFYLKTHMAKHTKEKIFRCEYCPAAYAWESGLTNHRKKHVENKSLECPKCSKIFVCDYDLKTHLRQVHPKEHRFHCEKCKYTTNAKDHYRRHLKIHSSFQPLKCNLCDKLFKEKKSVKRHLLVCHKMELNEKDDLEELIGKNEL